MAIPAVAMLIAMAVICYAAPVFSFLYENAQDLPIDGLFKAAREFPSLPTLLVICVLIWKLDPPRRYTIPVLLIAIVFSGLVNGGIKQVTGRARPHYGARMGPGQVEWINTYMAEHPGHVIGTERADQWLGLRTNRPYFESKFSSFPSGHANTSFVMAAHLCALYPQVRVVWFAVAGTCALSRVFFKSHYLGDILFGSALGWLMAQLIFSMPLCTRFGRWVERKISRAPKELHTQ